MNSDFIQSNLNSFILGVVFTAGVFLTYNIIKQYNKQQTERGRYTVKTIIIALSITLGMIPLWFLYDLLLMGEKDTFAGQAVFGVLQMLELTSFPVALLAMFSVVYTKKTTGNITSAAITTILVLAIVFLVSGNARIWKCAALAMIAYGVIAATIIHSWSKKYNASISDTYSNLAGRSASWVTGVTLSILAIIVLWTILNVVSYSHLLNITYNVMSFGIWILMYIQISRQIFDIREVTEEEKESAPSEDYPGAKLTEGIESFCSKYETFSNNELSIVDVAREIGSNRTYVSRWFHEQGTDFCTYISGKRLQYVACELVNSNSTITDIAVGAGFKSMPHFRNLFQEQFGCTPGEYRKKESKKEDRDA